MLLMMIMSEKIIPEKNFPDEIQKVKIFKHQLMKMIDELIEILKK
jgi:hypothetical protein